MRFLVKYKRASYFLINRQSRSKIFFLENDLQNDTFEALLTSYEERCNSRCSRTGCFHHWYFTEATVEGGMNFGVRANSPVKPSFMVTFKARIMMMEMIIYVLSCLGFWFGVSILSIHLLLFKWLRKRFSAGTSNRTRSTVRITRLEESVQILTRTLNRVIGELR